MATTPWGCTREEVQRALDVKITARSARQLDRAIEDASRSVEALTHRVFYPTQATRFFDWPDVIYPTPWRLWLDENELATDDNLVVRAGGTLLNDYFVRPENEGPPFTHIEVDRSTSDALAAGATPQQAIEITGLFGYRNDEAPAGALAEALDSSETGVDVTDSSEVGTGSVIRVEEERMIVTARSMLDTGQNSSALTAANNDVSITGVTAGTIFVDEVILVDSERMLVVDVAGTTLTIKRAWDGTVLAAHSNGADVYAPRTLTVERGALGTTAAAHNTATAVFRHVVPAPVRTLVVAEAINTLLQESAGYARVAGSGENAVEASGKGLKAKRDDVYARYGRKVRVHAV